VTAGTLFHAYKIQSGLNVAGHFAIQKVDDDFSPLESASNPTAPTGVVGMAIITGAPFFCGVQNFLLG